MRAMSFVDEPALCLEAWLSIRIFSLILCISIASESGRGSHF